MRERIRSYESGDAPLVDSAASVPHAEDPEENAGEEDDLLALDAGLLVESTSQELNVLRSGSVDDFLTHMYEYFRYGGRTGLLLTRFLQLFSALTTTILTFVLFFWANWGEILDCHSESCVSETPLLRPHPFSNISFFRTVVLSFVIFFSVFCFYLVFRLLKDVKRALALKIFYTKDLHIQESLLAKRIVEWNTIVDEFVSYQRRSSERFSAKTLDALDISHRVLRIENYLVALLNEKVLKMEVRIGNFMNFDVSMTRVLSWNIRRVLRAVLDESKKSFLVSSQTLRLYFFILGIANAFAAPFVLAFLLLDSVFRHTEEARVSPGTLFFSRSWSPAALWYFRELHEYPHVLEERMRNAHAKMEEYLDCFPSFSAAMIARAVSVPIGAIAAAILVASAIRSDILLAGKLFGWPLGLWLAGSAAIWAALVSLDKPSNTLKTCSDRETEMKLREVCEVLHMSCEPSVLKSFFPSRVWRWVQEIVSVVISPIVLCYVFPKCADDIAQFLNGNRLDVEGVGNVCATADFRAGHSIHIMERSLLNFEENHPTWNSTTRPYIAAWRRVESGNLLLRNDDNTVE